MPIPDLISGYLIDQLLAKPPAAHAIVVTIPLSTTTLPPFDLDVTPLEAYLTAAPALQLAIIAMK